VVTFYFFDRIFLDEMEKKKSVKSMENRQTESLLLSLLNDRILEDVFLPKMDDTVIPYLAQTCKILYHLTDEKRRHVKLIHFFEAVHTHNLNLLDYLPTNIPLGERVHLEAIAYGSTEVLKDLDRRACPRYDNCLFVASALGTPEVIEYLGSDAKPKELEVALACAAENGRFENVRWLHDRNKRLAESVGDLSYPSHRKHSRPVQLAILEDHGEIAQWLLAQGYPRNHIAAAIARKGDVHRLERCLDSDPSLGSYTFRRAVKSKNVDVVRCLIEHDCPLDRTVFVEAIVCEAWDIVELLQSHKPPVDKNAFKKAIEKNRTELAKWIYLHMDFDVESQQIVFSHAAAYGSIELLEWLIERGCHYDRSSSIQQAVMAKNFSSANWLTKNTTGRQFHLSVDAKGLDLEAVTYLHEKCGMKLSSKIIELAAQESNWDVFKWAIAHDCPIDEDTLVFIEGFGGTEFVKMLLESGYEYNINLCTCAITIEDVSMVIYLVRNNYPLPKDILNFFVKVYNKDARDIICTAFDLDHPPELDVPRRKRRIYSKSCSKYGMYWSVPNRYQLSTDEENGDESSSCADSDVISDSSSRSSDVDSSSRSSDVDSSSYSDDDYHPMISLLLLE
jgi:hypothetical protein